MFSKRVLIIVGVVIFIIANIIILSISGGRQSTQGFGRVALFFVAPFQEVVSDTIRLSNRIWVTYFSLASTAQENTVLKRSLRESRARNNQSFRRAAVSRPAFQPDEALPESHHVCCNRRAKAMRDRIGLHEAGSSGDGPMNCVPNASTMESQISKSPA